MSRIFDHPIKLFLLLFGTCLLLINSAYSHISYAAGSFEEITFSLLLNIFPIFGLFASILLLACAILVIFKNISLAIRLALTAAIIGCIYYFVMLCVMSLAYSVFFLSLPSVLVTFVIPAALLIWIIRGSWQLIKT